MTSRPHDPDETSSERDTAGDEQPASEGAPGAEIGLSDDDEGSSFEPEEDQ
ncbi:MAG TPA: hypothetical protein VFQ11_12085 [Nocardioidaceae bacterium]|nr:hypothetical protein [Nocardioidaceae bacterium]